MKLRTLFLKLATVGIGIPFLALYVFGLPWLFNNPVNPDYAHIIYPIVVGIFVAVIPFFVALYQTLKLLGHIDKNEAFSESSVKSLKSIRYCGIIVGAIFGVCLPFVFLVAEKDDAPGLVLVGLALTVAPIVIAVFASILQSLVENVIDRLNRNN